MHDITEFLFPAPAPRNAHSIIGWWERRRLAFNGFVGAAGVFSLSVMHIVSRLPPDAHGLPNEWPIPVIVFGVLANVCYFLGPACEIALEKVWGGTLLPSGPMLYRMGLTFSVGLALLPTLLVGIDWLFRIVRVIL
jgi:hypothetical protein